MADDADLRRIQRLIEELESEDAFERREAIESLSALTRLRHGYEWAAADSERARAVRRWRKWLEREQEQQKGREVQATIQLLTQGQVDPAALQKLLKSLPAEQKKALLAQLVIAKAAAESPGTVPHAACEECKQRPSTVRITSRDAEGAYHQRALCEICAARMDS